jgi:hypothetical protein
MNTTVDYQNALLELSYLSGSLKFMARSLKDYPTESIMHILADRAEQLFSTFADFQGAIEKPCNYDQTV